jgi:hypothetical protein
VDGEVFRDVAGARVWSGECYRACVADAVVTVVFGFVECIFFFKINVYGVGVWGDMDGVDRLSLVSKLLMDMRLLELKSENEDLKLKLFWKEYNPNMLKKNMTSANKVTDGPRCACLACIVGGRCEDGTLGFATYAFVNQYDDHVIMSPYDRCHLRCQFKSWFEAKILESGMSVSTYKASVDGDSVRDVGQHFSNLGTGDWNAWVYGSWVAYKKRNFFARKIFIFFEKNIIFFFAFFLFLIVVKTKFSLTYTSHFS